MNPSTRFLNYLFILFLLLFGYACQNNRNNRYKNQRLKKSELVHIDLTNIKKGLNINDILDDITFIPLETTDSSIIAEITKVIYYGDRFYIFDLKFQSLKVFDLNGKYINSIGRIGNGPGEYKELDDFIIDPKTKHILLLDNGKQSIHEFDLDGNFIKSWRVNIFATHFNIIGDKYYFHIGQNISALSKNFHLIVMDKSGKVINRMFPFPPNFNYGTPSGFLVSNSEGMLYNSSFNDTVSQISINSVYPKYVFKFGPNKIPKDIQLSVSKFLKEGNHYSYLLNKIEESKNYLVFTFLSKTKLYTAFCMNWNLATHGSQEQIRVIPRILNFPIGRPLGMKDSTHFISSISVPRLLLILNHTNNIFSTATIKKNYPSLYKLLPSLKKSANPILTIFKLKENTFKK